jgi:hypothetical protein
VQLKVYDILGREVATLVNEEKQAGTYQIQFNNQPPIGNKQYCQAECVSITRLVPFNKI